MTQALYRKYRSRSWDELVGQEYVRTTLQNAVKSGKLGHAYLFSGPRGVGKTSVARLLARQINGLAYTSDESHVDIIEIDAASNTSVEDIRDLRERVAVAPSLAKYKIYIIDEVHMLSKSAFNALLKTLEEPPAHVIFILATTDPQRLPETIISRTQHFAFKPIERRLAAKQLKAIADKENILLDDDAAELIASLGEGSFRDSLSLLDQLASSGEEITKSRVETVAGLPPAEMIGQIASAVDAANPSRVIELLSGAHDHGYQTNSIAKQLGIYWRAQAVATSDSFRLAIAKQLLTVDTSHRPDEYLEIILLEAALSGDTPSPATRLRPDDVNPGKHSEPRSANLKPAKPTKNTPSAAVVDEPAITSKALTRSTTDAVELWQTILDGIRAKHPTLYSQARMAKPSLEENTLKLEFGHKFQYERLKDGKNREIVLQLASGLAGKNIAVTCELNPSLADYKPEMSELAAPKADPPITEPISQVETPGDINNISNIFGGGELLQS